jgi:hypothetical protein
MLHQPHGGSEHDENLDNLEDNRRNAGDALNAPQQHADNKQDNNSVNKQHHVEFSLVDP